MKIVPNHVWTLRDFIGNIHSTKTKNNNTKLPLLKNSNGEARDRKK